MFDLITTTKPAAIDQRQQAINQLVNLRYGIKLNWELYYRLRESNPPQANVLLTEIDDDKVVAKRVASGLYADGILLSDDALTESAIEAGLYMPAK